MMRKFTLLIGVATALVVGFTAVATARYRSHDSPVAPVSDVALPAGAADRLAGAIRIPTVSAADAARGMTASATPARRRRGWMSFIGFMSMGMNGGSWIVLRDGEGRF